MSFSDCIKEKAIELGFDLVGISPACRAKHADSLQNWLAKDYHGSMKWLTLDRQRREDSRKAWAEAKSIVSVGLSYFTENPPEDSWNHPLRGRIARYAWGRDYHFVMKKMLRKLLHFIQIEGKVYVDTGPLLEHDIAALSGIGFTGKNTLTINSEWGSFVFLGEILLSKELEYDTEMGNGTCGSCMRCIQGCPTQALVKPYQLDARKCISYLTIEHRDIIPEEMRAYMKNWIFGCDECQMVCPWVKRYAKPGKNVWLKYNADLYNPWLPKLITLSDMDFKRLYKGTPLLRTKRSGLLRNATIAMGNSHSTEALPALNEALRDEDPLVRKHADWAIRRIRNFTD